MKFDRHSRTEDFLRLLLGVSLELASAPDDELDTAIERTLGAIGAVLVADRVYITLRLPDDAIANSHEWLANGQVSHKQVITGRRLSEFPYSAQLLVTGEVWKCTDVDALPDAAEAERDSFGQFGVKAVLQIPMRDGGRRLGVLGFNHLEIRDWSDETVAQLRALGDAIGLALLRRDANLRLRIALDDAERANRAKDLFLSKVSHELRTPLHAILGFAELLEVPERTVSEREALRQIEGSGRQLLGLVEEMLDETDRRTATQPPIE